MEKVTNTIKSASSIIAILAISAFSFNTFASEVESNKSYSCVETATENSCNLIITKPTAEDKKLVEEWKQKVEFSTCSVETDERIECNITAYYEDLEKEISELVDSISLSEIIDLYQIGVDENSAKTKIIFTNNGLKEITTDSGAVGKVNESIKIKIMKMIRYALSIALISSIVIMLAWFIILLSLRLYFTLDLLLAYAIVKLCGSKSSKEDI